MCFLWGSRKGPFPRGPCSSGCRESSGPGRAFVFPPFPPEVSVLTPSAASEELEPWGCEHDWGWGAIDRKSKPHCPLPTPTPCKSRDPAQCTSAQVPQRMAPLPNGHGGGAPGLAKGLFLPALPACLGSCLGPVGRVAGRHSAEGSRVEGGRSFCSPARWRWQQVRQPGTPGRDRRGLLAGWLFRARALRPAFHSGTCVRRKLLR